ncbi:MAG: dihydroorotate dehydrogenase electron transfer subunit [Dehalococcoidia bacterium]
MNVGYAEVVSNERLYAQTYEIWLRAPELAAGAYPGQFVMLRCSDDEAYGGVTTDDGRDEAGTTDNRQQTTAGEGVAASAGDYDPLLPRPMSYARMRDGAQGAEWSLLYDVVGRGTAWMSRRRPGDRVYAWGPLGRGYEIGRGAQNLLLVAGGIGVAPLVWLSDDAVAKGLNVTLIIGARSAEHVYPSRLLRPEVEVVVTTDDGSAGRKGFATEAFAELFDWCDEAFACGPTPMFRALAEVVRRTRLRRPVQVLVEERMGCGTGICYGCAVEVRKRGGREMKLVCRDGPRFDVRDVY